MSIFIPSCSGRFLCECEFHLNDFLCKVCVVDAKSAGFNTCVTVRWVASRDSVSLECVSEKPALCLMLIYCCMDPNILLNSGHQLHLNGTDAMDRRLMLSVEDTSRHQMFTKLTYMLYFLYFLQDTSMSVILWDIKSSQSTSCSGAQCQASCKPVTIITQSNMSNWVL